MWVPLHLVTRNDVLRIVEGETEFFPLVVEEKTKSFSKSFTLSVKCPVCCVCVKRALQCFSVTEAHGGG